MSARSFLRPPLAALFVLSAISLSFAQSSYESAKSASVLDAIQLYESSRSAGSLSAVEQAQQVRLAALAQLMQSDPAAVIGNALPSNLVARLPRAAQSAFEKHVTATGVLEVAVEDGSHSSKMHYNMMIGGRRIGLHLAGTAPGELLTGMYAQVKGVQVGEELALNSTDLKTSTTTSSTTSGASTSVLPNTFGAQQTLVILVNFQDNASQPWTPTTVSNLVFGTGTGTVNGYYQDASFGQASLIGDVAGWYTIPVSTTNCSTSSIQTYAQQAAQSAGYVLSNYARYVYAFPSNSGCSWSGWSYVGGKPSNSWINGNMSLRVVAHELGHAFGLYHSHSYSCTNGGVQVTLGGTCSTIDYGDQLDDMGSPFPMYFNASQKERLGWLSYGSSPPITTVTASGTYTMAPYETNDGLPKALKILQSSTSNTYYYIESRQFIGDDKYVQTTSVLSSVLFHLSSPSNGNSSDILQMDPSSTNVYGWENPGLQQGSSYTDSAAGVTITPISVTSTGATVQVNFGPSTCTAASPNVTISPSQSASVAAGTPVNYTVTVKNNDSASCPAAAFNLNASLPSGWAGVFNSSSLSISPGLSGSATLTVTSPAGIADGSYPLGVSATNSADSSLSASVNATYFVYTPAPLNLTVTTNQPSYLPGQTVTITVSVLAGTNPDPGASVSVTVTPPSGKGNTQSATTGSNGSASVTYKLSKRASAGTYSVQANTTSTGAASITGASTAFTVQ